MKTAALALVIALWLCVASALAGQAQPKALAAVAQKLGLVYAYLGADDEVTLAAHGLSVVVRPGVPYFTLNDREEPIPGGKPFYRAGDVYISPQFAQRLGELERAAATSYHSPAQSIAHVNVAPSGGAAQNVTTVNMSAVPGSDDVEVSGAATPGAVVAIVLKAMATPDLPTIYLNRSFAIAGAAGTYAIDIPTAPEYFSGSIFIAEAAALDDVKPMTASYSPPQK